jgi:hypothetical protein
MFNNYIANSPHGKTIIHATQIGEYSYDSSTGGYFTKALLNISTRVKTETYKPIFITRVLDFVPQVLQKQGNSQVPCITYTEGNLIVPFAIAVPQTSQPKPQPRIVPQKQYATTNNNSSGTALALFGLGLLLLIAAAE